MKLINQLFHFLGSIRLAIALIAIAAIVVIVGTLLESKTGSHLLAARWTYEHPFFLLLLSLFFINILFSTLRRWPFKKRHIPFLLTHLGLLMIISGTMIKNRFGLQGQLTIWEGSGNQHVLLPHTYALAIEEKGQSAYSPHFVPLDSFRSDIDDSFHLPKLKCKLIGYAPHVKECLETWIKGSKAYIAGFPLIHVHDWEPAQPFPEATIYSFALAKNSPPQWSILALRTSHVQEALQQAYLQKLHLYLKAKRKLFEADDISVQKALQNPFPFANGFFSASLFLPFSFAEEEGRLPCLNCNWKSHIDSSEENVFIPLQGSDALLIRSVPPQWSESSFTVDLRRSNPMLCLIADEQDHTFLFAFDTYGRIHGEKFSSSHLRTLVSYEQGFSGYGVQATVPFPLFPASREDKEKANAYALMMQLQQALAKQPSLIPPLSLFEKACQLAQIDFISTFVEFLVEWKNSPGFLYRPCNPIPEKINRLLQKIDWQKVSNQDKQAILWIHQMLDRLENHWKQGENPFDILRKQHWPFIDELQQVEQTSLNFSLLNLLSQQIASLMSHFPCLDFPSSLSNLDQAALLSAYFRAYDIDYRLLFPFQGNGQEQFDHLESYWKAHSDPINNKMEKAIIFETPLSHRVIPEAVPLKLEDQRPGIVLEIQEGQNKENIVLAYDSLGTGFKWPILNGNYLLRFQPKLKELPYRIRLRQARQIAYPQSQQIYSYESDLLISEKGSPSIEQTLSMNRVYETWDGYRFYLGGIANSADASLKRIQLAVNYDPAKYFLTYPGALLVFIGTILLFWIFPYHTKKH